MTQRAAAFLYRGARANRKDAPQRHGVRRELADLQERLGQRTLDLADSNRDLKQGITERQSAEAALERSERASRSCFTSPA
jgi:phosphoglycerate-specific signal transduction histidine kinase